MVRMWSLETLFIGVCILLPPSYEAMQRKKVARNCKELQDGGSESGMYLIKPKHSLRPFLVYCDMETDGGGWVVVLNRADDRQDFDLPWHEYKVGFGSGSSYWLGLEYLYQLTTDEPNELLMEVTDFDNTTYYVKYNNFSIGCEDEAYRLKLIDGYSGDLNDAFTYNSGQKFSTVDRNNEMVLYPNSCSDVIGGGWWYNDCSNVMLTGKYVQDVKRRNMKHFMRWIIDFERNVPILLKEARMMVRPVRNSGDLHKDTSDKVLPEGTHPDNDDSNKLHYVNSIPTRPNKVKGVPMVVDSRLS